MFKLYIYYCIIIEKCFNNLKFVHNITKNVNIIIVEIFNYK